jgi:xanthine dehydrogenase small subunit
LMTPAFLLPDPPPHAAAPTAATVPRRKERREIKDPTASTYSRRVALGLRVDGRDVSVADDGASLLEVLRDRLGLRTMKDGCSPQGQCGCCTVLVDGNPRVACVTPARRVAGREITTLDGLPAATRQRWAEAFCGAGASQCGFCTPGIIVRLAALADATPARVETALLAHLCRCTGWRTIIEAAVGLSCDRPARDLAAASRRAALEGGSPQSVGPEVAAGHGGFADDSAPGDALIAVPDAAEGWAVGETLSEARAAAAAVGKVQGRRSGVELSHPLDVPAGDWAVTLRTTWVEPAYVELDASWCRPGEEPAAPLGNGGAFGGKLASPAPAVARRLADKYGRPVRVLLSREDAVRLGPKRPPVAAGVRADGTGVVRVVRTPGISEAIRSVGGSRLAVEEIDVPGPPTSVGLRAAGWAEAAVLLAAAAGPPVQVVSPSGARARASVDVDSAGLPTAVSVQLACGDPLDEVVLRSYATGAAHMALGWVCSEAIAVDSIGVPQDLTIRSFGILRARDTPPIDVTIDRVGAEQPAVNGSDAVFAAVAAATWIAQDLPQDWPTRRGRF